MSTHNSATEGVASENRTPERGTSIGLTERRRRARLPQDEIDRRYAETIAGWSQAQRASTVDIPARYLPLYKRAIIGDLSGTAERKAHCQRCVNYEELPAAVAECTATSCVHWRKRPYQAKGVVR